MFFSSASVLNYGILRFGYLQMAPLLPQHYNNVIYEKMSNYKELKVYTWK